LIIGCDVKEVNLPRQTSPDTKPNMSRERDWLKNQIDARNRNKCTSFFIGYPREGGKELLICCLASYNRKIFNLIVFFKLEMLTNVFGTQINKTNIKIL